MTPEPRLLVKDSEGTRTVALDRPRLLLGRGSGVDILFVNADVSREHAEIICADRRVVLRDLGSRYGTFVNHVRVDQRVLEHGDRIQLGRAVGLEIVFSLDDDTPTGLHDTASDSQGLRQMAAILDGLRALGSGRVLDEVLTLVTDLALEITKAERGFVMLAGPDGELGFTVARARNRQPLPSAPFITSRKIPREVFRTGCNCMIGDLAGPNQDEHSQTVHEGIRQVLCVPLTVAPLRTDTAVAPKRIGVLYLDGHVAGTLTSVATAESLEALATQAAIAIESARLYAEAAEKARLDRELRIAAEIQQALLPSPEFDGGTVVLAATSLPCRTVGGDFFDYLALDHGALGFALGDVAGKGPPAALLAATVQSNLAAHAPLAASPADTMDRLNRALLRRAVAARFATMFYGTVGSDGLLTYCNAGQEPPLLLQADGVAWLDVGGPVLGLLPEATYDYATVPLSRGDLIVVCSDGVTEARNAAGDWYGRERIVRVLEGCRGAPPDRVLASLLDDLRAFAQGMAQADDITLLVLRVGAATDVR